MDRETPEDIPVCPEDRNCAVCESRPTCPAVNAIPSSFNHRRKAGFNHWRANQRTNAPRGGGNR